MEVHGGIIMTQSIVGGAIQKRSQNYNSECDTCSLDVLYINVTVGPVHTTMRDHHELCSCSV